jgi:hypothetical protein
MRDISTGSEKIGNIAVLFSTFDVKVELWGYFIDSTVDHRHLW